MLRLVLKLQSGDETNPTSFNASQESRRRWPSPYVTAGFIMFFLFLAATILYWTKALLSLKETLCLLEHLQSGRQVTIAEEEGTRIVAEGCRAIFWIEGKIVNELDNSLCLAFAVLAQLFLFIADGLLVLRPPPLVPSRHLDLIIFFAGLPVLPDFCRHTACLRARHGDLYCLFR